MHPDPSVTAGVLLCPVFVLSLVVLRCSDASGLSLAALDEIEDFAFLKSGKAVKPDRLRKSQHLIAFVEAESPQLHL